MVVVTSSISLAGSLDPGLVGLGLTYAILVAINFQFCVRLSTEVENSVSVLSLSLYDTVIYILVQWNL